MKRAYPPLLMMLACEAEPQLAVHRASLVDETVAVDASVSAVVVNRTVPVAPTVEVEERTARFRREITLGNVRQAARDLNATLDQEMDALESKLSPINIDMGN